MKKNELFSILGVFLTVLVSCEREPMKSSKNVENILNNEVLEIKSGWDAMDLDTSLAGLPMKEMVVDWENPVQRDSVYEFPMAQEFPTVLNSSRFRSESLSLVVYNGADRLYRVVRMLHTLDSSRGSTFLEPSGWDGTVHVYDLYGTDLLVMAYEKGALVASAVNKDLKGVPEVELSKSARCNTRKSASSSSLRSYDTDCSGGGGYDRVRVEHYTDWFNYRGNGQWEFQRSEHTGTTYEYVYSPGAGYGGSTIYRETVRPYGGSSAAFNNWWRQNSIFFKTTPEDYERKYKIINELTGKADCVYKELQRKNPNLFINTIRKFIDDPEYKLVLSIGPLPPGNFGADAVTLDRVSSDDQIRIIINENNANDNPIELARTILHEGIHAEITRFVHRKSRDYTIKDRPRLMQLFSYYIGLLGEEELDSPHLEQHIRKKMSDAQHNYMAERFIKPMASALHQFDNKKFTIKEYESLAWAGLEKTYNYLSNFTDAERSEIDRIGNRILNSSKNNPNGPCN